MNEEIFGIAYDKPECIHCQILSRNGRFNIETYTTQKGGNWSRTKHRKCLFCKETQQDIFRFLSKKTGLP